MAPDLDDIKFVVAKYFGVTIPELESNNPERRLNEKRHIVMWLARRHTTLHLRQIGEGMGCREHHTISSGEQVIETRRFEEPGLRHTLETLETKLADHCQQLAKARAAVPWLQDCPTRPARAGSNTSRQPG